MRACARCGTLNPLAAAACGACGGPLADGVLPAPSGGLKQTMIGIAEPMAPRPEQKAPGRGPAVALGGTMIGIQSPFASAPPPQPSAPQPAAHPPASQSAAAPVNLKQTMMGFAPLPASPLPPSPLPNHAWSAAPPTAPPQAPFQRTMLGVAQPGIAPLRAGGAEVAPRTPRAEHVPPRPQTEARTVRSPGYTEQPDPRELRHRAKAADRPARRRFPKSALILLGVAFALAAVAGVVALLWDSPRPIRAEVVLDDRGAELLALTCDDCADGTQVSIGANHASFSGKKATLALSQNLRIGSNELAVAVKRTGLGRDEQVTLTVGVDYLVRGLLTSLAEDPPKVKVAVEALPGSAAIVDGRAVPLDASGKGELAIDVSSALEGPADATEPFERKIPYAISQPGKPPRPGQVILRFGIVPLRIEAPGESIVIDGETFMLSGRTLKDGRVTVSGRPITVDTAGRFAQLMNVSSIGETTIVVRAEAKDHAPRLVRVRVKRVSSLRDEAATFRRSATTDYGSIAAADEKKGLAVALDGEVLDGRLDGEVTLLLIDVKNGCTALPCLARVEFGGHSDARQGMTISAYGHLTGLVDGPRTGARIPQMHADFIVVTGVGKRPR